MKTLAFAKVGGIFVLASNDNPTDSEWKAWLDFMIQHQAALATSRTLVVATGNGGPNALQRGQLATILRAHGADQMPAAIMTESAFTRGVVTAISWLVKGPRSFALCQMTEACDYLEISPGLKPEVLAKLQHLQNQLPILAKAG